MQRPNCKTENPNDTTRCSKCNTKLTSTVQPKQTCRLAIWSFILAVSTPGFIYVAINISGPAIIEFCSLLLLLLPPVLALLFAIFAIVQIRKRRGLVRGQGFAIATLVVLSFWLCIWLFLPIMMRRTKEPYFDIKQKAQFISIAYALELFNTEFNGYPPSNSLDPTGQPYCGAMKLAEAMMGQDLMGYHPDSIFRSDGSDGTKFLYPDANSITLVEHKNNLSMRKRYLPAENADAFRLRDLYADTGPFDSNKYVLCDVYRNVIRRVTGKRVGMPILYYKANTSLTAHDVDDPDNPENIYNYRDNQSLLGLGVPQNPETKHPLFTNPRIFYEMTKSHNVTIKSKTVKAGSYILISAGFDGLYGTQDDIVYSTIQWKKNKRRQ